MITRYFEPGGDMPKVTYSNWGFDGYKVTTDGYVLVKTDCNDYHISEVLHDCTIHLYRLEDALKVIPDEEYLLYFRETIETYLTVGGSITNFVKEQLQSPFKARVQSINDLLFKYNIDADNYIEKGQATKIQGYE